MEIYVEGSDNKFPQRHNIHIFISSLDSCACCVCQFFCPAVPYSTIQKILCDAMRIESSYRPSLQDVRCVDTGPCGVCTQIWGGTTNIPGRSLCRKV